MYDQIDARLNSGKESLSEWGVYFAEPIIKVELKLLQSWGNGNAKTTHLLILWDVSAGLW